MAATVDAGIRAGRIAPLLVVGIENTQRRRDMTGPTQVDSDRRIAPVVGGSAAFRAFIAEELVPEIARRYRTTGARGIIGESLAGLFIVETLFEQPALFDTWIAFSPSLWWNDAALTRSADARLQRMPGLQCRMLLAWGDEDNIGPHAQALSDTARRAGPAHLQWQALPRPDLRHDTIYTALEAMAIERMYPAPPRHRRGQALSLRRMRPCPGPQPRPGSMSGSESSSAPGLS
ncbi:alpha/beta hydrolase-fold protein [Stenotrophomonas acidaminiphila]|uniref:alpha/beta hydrolase n=1 Tax=Stenotrophomonas acidaminiphila TaxID=128780 RepID=UPI0028ACA4D3|nr:alpha/beta hydrolase-fold protein [Stenotrophomonas acidaminiphila]